ncbi:MAG: hypothetical protein MK364_11095, partial [Pirellulales bacterium]|nr:hypothetical protein [Pirellulales bacterium]
WRQNVLQAAMNHGFPPPDCVKGPERVGILFAMERFLCPSPSDFPPNTTQPPDPHARGAPK